MAKRAKNNFKPEKSVRFEARMCSKANTRRLLMKVAIISRCSSDRQTGQSIKTHKKGKHVKFTYPTTKGEKENQRKV